MRKWIFVALLFVSLIVTFGLQAQSSDIVKVCRGFLPENNLWIPDGTVNLFGKATGITHAQFDQVMNRISAEYSSEVASHGAKLNIERKWKDGTVNAYAYRSDDQQTWFIDMFGGMARYPTMTYDGMMTVACHELGHHLGGAPKFSDGNDWASVEGEADYYATLKCLRRMFAHDDNAKILAGMKVDATAVKGCGLQGFSAKEKNICIRSSMAGVHLANVLAALGSDRAPKLSTRDRTQVARTDEQHPQAQCRMDTYFQGALCPVPVSSALSDNDYRPGSCVEGQYNYGSRPRCWFAP